MRSSRVRTCRRWAHYERSTNSALRVPEDLALISFDGTPESEFTWPQLSVVRQPLNEMARLAVATILQPRNRPPAAPSFGWNWSSDSPGGCPRLPA
ncbi:MAG: substrate-binding domain-containing protein [Galbitalea sp.]